MKNRARSFVESRGFISFLASVASICIGLIFGYFLLIYFNPAMSLSGLLKILITGVSSPEKFAKVLYQAAPLIFTGLSVALCGYCPSNALVGGAYRGDAGRCDLGVLPGYLQGAFQC